MKLKGTIGIFIVVSILLIVLLSKANTFNFSNIIIDPLQKSIDQYSNTSFKYESLLQYELKLKIKEKKNIDTINAYESNIKSIELKINALVNKKYIFNNQCDSLNAIILNDSIQLLKKIYDQNIAKLNQYKANNNSKINLKEVSSLQLTMAKYRDSLSQEVATIRKFIDTLKGSKILVFKKASYQLFIVDLNKHDVNFHLNNAITKQKYRSIGSLKDDLSKQNKIPLMITNAGMYTPQNDPEGLYIENNKLLFELDTNNIQNGDNFWLMPNGVFWIDSNNIPFIASTNVFKKKYAYSYKDIKIATQSGPLLLRNDTIHEAFTRGSSNLKIRSGVGIINKERIVFVTTVDNSNFYDFTLFFKDILGCKDALFLDGAISLMYLKDLSPNTIGGDFGAMISVSEKPIEKK